MPVRHRTRLTVGLLLVASGVLMGAVPAWAQVPDPAPDSSLPGGSLKGTLGFLEFTAVNKDVNGDGDQTHLNLNFAIDIGNSAKPTDTRLGLSELGNISFDVLVGAEASVELGMTLGIAGDDGDGLKLGRDYAGDSDGGLRHYGGGPGRGDKRGNEPEFWGDSIERGSEVEH